MAQMAVCGAACSVGCGVTAGAVAGTLFYPLEAVEARLQVDTRLVNKPVTRAAAAMYRDGGLAAFTSGMGASVMGQAVNWGVYFFVSALVERTLQGLAGGGSVASPLLLKFIALVLAGAITCVVVNPFWMVRNRQVGADAAGKGGGAASAVEVLASIVRDGGPFALLTGVRASLLNTFEGAIQWTLLAQLQSMYTSSVWADFVAGAVARIVGVAATYPSQVLRARMQASDGSGDTSLAGTFRGVLRHNGVAGLYSGLLANIPRQLGYGGVLTAVLEGCERLVVTAALTVKPGH